MGIVVLEKEVPELKGKYLCDISVILSLDGKRDSTLLSKYVRTKDAKKFGAVKCQGNSLGIHIVDEVTKIKKNNDGSVSGAETSHVALIAKEFKKIAKEVRTYAQSHKEYVTNDFVTLTMFKIYFMACLADESPVSCVTVFPCSIGASNIGQELDQLNHLKSSEMLEQLRIENPTIVNSDFYNSFGNYKGTVRCEVSHEDYLSESKKIDRRVNADRVLGAATAVGALVYGSLLPAALLGMFSYKFWKDAIAQDAELARSTVIMEDYVLIAMHGKIGKHVQDNCRKFAEVWRTLEQLAIATDSHDMFELEENMSYLMC